MSDQPLSGVLDETSTGKADAILFIPGFGGEPWKDSKVDGLAEAPAPVG